MTKHRAGLDATDRFCRAGGSIAIAFGASSIGRLVKINELPGTVGGRCQADPQVDGRIANLDTVGTRSVIGCPEASVDRNPPLLRKVH